MIHFIVTNLYCFVLCSQCFFCRSGTCNKRGIFVQSTKYVRCLYGVAIFCTSSTSGNIQQLQFNGVTISQHANASLDLSVTMAFKLS